MNDLRSRLNIVEIVADYVPLKQKGRKHWGLCPFHGEKTPSFSVDEQSQMYYCFGCHKGGAVIQFVMDIERMEFLDAVRMLADRAQMTLPDRMQAPGDDSSRALREQILAANLEAAHYYHQLIWQPEGAEALGYLHRRGLDDAGIRRFGLGATGPGYDLAAKHLLAKGFEDEVLLKAGLLVKREARQYDMFRNRVVFPIIAPHGQVLGFGGRLLGEGNPKYLNTADTPVFNKRRGLYALNMVRKERGLQRLILVEGYMDVVSLRQQGVKGVVATLGTALTPEQARLIKRYAPEVWLCYDGDSAGQRAILRALDILEEAAVPARVIDVPGGMDPDDYVRAEGAEGFERLAPMPPPAYRMRRAADGLDLATQEGRTQYAIASCQILRRGIEPVELENYLRTLSAQTGFAREVLLEQIGKAAPAPEAAPRRPRPLPRRREYAEHERAEMTLIYLLSKHLIREDVVVPALFITPLFKNMAQSLISGESPAAILDRLPDENRDLAAAALQLDEEIEQNKAVLAAQQCYDKIHRFKLTMRIDETKKALKEETDPSRRMELMRRIKSLTSEWNSTGRKE